MDVGPKVAPITINTMKVISSSGPENRIQEFLTNPIEKQFSILRVLFATLAVVIAVTFCGWYFGYLQPFGLYRPANALMVIEPYKYAGTWVFDDSRVGLEREPFVAGIPEMIDDMVKDIPNADKGFRLLFSTRPFPGQMAELSWRRTDNGGNWYYCEKYQKEGWLCPGLFRYYKDAPKQIYTKAERK